MYSLLAISCNGHRVKVYYCISLAILARDILRLYKNVALISVLCLLKRLALDSGLSF